MKIAIGYNGSMVVKDTNNNIHMFSPEETRRITTAIYKWVQKKDEGIQV